MAVIKKGLVKRSGYRKNTNHNALDLLITDCIAAGSIATLFKDPHILAAFYIAGGLTKTALSTAISDYNNSTNGGSIDTVRAKMALVVIWLDSYADQVEVIANDTANRTTQEEAVANIGISHLTAQKIAKASKGRPLKPNIIGEYITGGIIKVKVTNGNLTNYSTLTVLAVSVPPVSDPPVAPAVVTLNGDQLSVSCAVAVNVITKTIKGKPSEATFVGVNPEVSYQIYAITQNGVKLISYLSNPILVKP